MRTSFFSVCVAGAFILGNAAAAEGIGDVEAGQKLYRKCASCHMVGADAVNRVGPVLTNVFGSAVAAVPDFRYSDAIKAQGQAGAVWDTASLDAFLANPKGYLPGNRMSFRGMSNETERANVIAYLRSLAADDGTAVVVAGFTVAADVLAITGDIEYGEYLASECKTCHLASGGGDGIPGIVGLPNDAFATLLHAYRAKHLDNPVMQLVANRLNDEEIAALAAYFENLEE